ncbi:hypothetical protein FS837_010839 [Tulasnella sp. UAMH 9824]|nr:hypothetical protein FS837_010839 [Tulasnella sp. UAMH 9824]
MAGAKRKAEEQPANTPAAKKLNPKIKPTNKTKKDTSKHEQDHTRSPKKAKVPPLLADSPVKTRQRARSARGLESDQWAADRPQGCKPAGPSKETRQKVTRTQRAKAFSFYEQGPPPAAFKAPKPKTSAAAPKTSAAAPKTFAAAAAAAATAPKTFAAATTTAPKTLATTTGVSSAAAHARAVSTVARPVSAVASASSTTVAAAKPTVAAVKPTAAAAAAAAARPAAAAAIASAVAAVGAGAAAAIAGAAGAVAVAGATATSARPISAVPSASTIAGPVFPACVFASTPAHLRSTYRPRSHQKLLMDVDAHTYPPAQFGPSTKGPLTGFKRSPLQETTNVPTESHHVREDILMESAEQMDCQEWEEAVDDPFADDPLVDEAADEDNRGGTGPDIERGGIRWEMDSDEEAPVQAPGHRRVTGPRPRDYFDDEDMGDAQDTYQPEPQEPESEDEPEEIEPEAPHKPRHTRRSRKGMEDESEEEGEGGDSSGKGSANRCLRGISAERRTPVRLAYIRLRCYTATRNPFPTPEEENEMIDKAWKWVKQHRQEYANLELLPVERPVIHVFITNIRGKIKASARKKVEAAYPWSHRRSENIQLYNRLMENDAYMHKNPDALTGRWLNRLLFSIIQDIFFCGKNADGLKQKKLFAPISLQLIALVYTAIHCALDEWEKGEHFGLQFSADAYQEVYLRHLQNLNSLQDHDESAVDVVRRLVWDRCSGRPISDKARKPPALHTDSDHEKTVRDILAEAHLDAMDA